MTNILVEQNSLHSNSTPKHQEAKKMEITQFLPETGQSSTLDKTDISAISSVINEGDDVMTQTTSSDLENKDSEAQDQTTTQEDLLKQIYELKLQNEKLLKMLNDKNKNEEKFGSFRINPSDVYENLKYLQVCSSPFFPL